jgi:Tol biopolymer transport system component
MVVGCTPPAEPVTDFKTYTLEQFLKTTSIRGGYFNHDETKLLVSSNETGVYNVFSIDIVTGERTQLTDSEDTTFAVAYLPDDDRFLFTRDEGGNELDSLYIQDEEGNITKLTRADNTKEIFLGYSKDFSSFFTINNSRDQRFFDVYKWDVETLEPAMFYQNQAGMNMQAISDDERWIALQKVNTRYDSDMYLIDKEGDGTPVLLSETEGEVNYSPETFTPDNEKLLYTTDKDSDFMYLMSYDLATGEHEEVFRADWDVAGVGFS